MNLVNVIDLDGNYEIRKSDNDYSFKYASLEEAFMFEYFQVVPFGSTMLSMCRADDIIENTHMPDKEISLLSVAEDFISVGSLIKAIKMTKNLDKVFNNTQTLETSVKLLSLPMSPKFEDYMSDLTLFQGIRGSSIEDVKLKASWANSYGEKLYKNNVEITNDVRREYGDAYRKQFESVGE